MENTDRSGKWHEHHPLIASLLGGFRQTGRNGRESTEESMRYPPEILRGFAFGAFLGVLLVAATLWLFRQAFFSPMAQAASQPGTPGFWIFWIAAGFLTALLVTGGFLLVAALQMGMLIWKPWPEIHFIPATGENEEEDKDEPEG